MSGDRAHAPERANSSLAELTLDVELQRSAERLLALSRAPEGAIVMSDTRTGRILVWVTRGSRDLVRTPAAPGASLFKVVTATALLEGEHVHRNTRQCFGGGERRIEPADIALGCRPGEDRIAFGEALGHSVNVVFARLAAAHLAPSQLRAAAAGLGIGAPLPFDLPADSSQVLVPEDRLGMARAAAGFGQGSVTPLSALFLMQTIANRGKRVRLNIRADDDRAAPLFRRTSHA